MARLTSSIAFVFAVGCGHGPNASEPESVVEIAAVSQPSREPAAKPRAISGAETALEACLAPIDPSAFSKLGGGPRPEKKHKSVAPRKLPLIPPTDPCDAQPSSVECAYRDARVHFEERRFDLAAKGFRKIALETEVTDEGLFAGQLALEAMNMIGTYAEPPRPICFDVIASDNDKLIDRYCPKPVRADREESCFTFFQIARDVRRLHAESLVKTADSGGPNPPTPLYEQAGDEYRALFDEACDPKADKAQARNARCDELLFNAHRAYRAAGARAKMEAAYRTFFDPRFGLDKSPLAEKLAPADK